MPYNQTFDRIYNFMFGTKKPYDLDVRPRFQYDVFMLRKSCESGFSRMSGNAGQNCQNIAALVAPGRLTY